MKISRLRRLLVVALVLLAACSSSSGPDLAKTVNGIESMATASVTDLPSDASGVDAVWRSPGSVVEAADVISAASRPDERADDAGGQTFLLYKSGTIWITEDTRGSLVALYKSNDTAYSRHSGTLIRYNTWGSRVGSYSSGGGSSSGGNSFRGGGSSSGK